MTPNDVVRRRPGDGANTVRLSPSELTRLRARLLRELEEQMELAAQQVEDLEHLPAGAAGALEVERDLAEELLSLRAETIDRITEALARIDDDAYGTCEGCQRTIPIERLEVVPHARFCVTCQGLHQRVGR